MATTSFGHETWFYHGLTIFQALKTIPSIFAFAYFRVLDATAIGLKACLSNESGILEEWNKVILRGHSLATYQATHASFHFRLAGY